MVTALPRPEQPGQNEEEQQEEQRPVKATRTAANLSDRLAAQAHLAFGGDLAGHDQADVIDATAIVALPETRHQLAAAERAQVAVGQQAFKAVAGVDAPLTVTNRHGEQQAVVLALLAQLPLVEQADVESLERFAPGGGQGQHDHLGPGFLLEFQEGRGQPSFEPILDHAGAVDHVAGRPGQLEGLQRPQGREQAKPDDDRLDLPGHGWSRRGFQTGRWPELP
ncbi:MAG: hypothetical protein BWY87_01128 [Deltaproteobacteria bacterium ADurb.Bin510]|nr:MAG: hypothetical protein BWY87_01128 [Deltaproteobacteria bacterium ADurb.Bin510]